MEKSTKEQEKKKEKRKKLLILSNRYKCFDGNKWRTVQIDFSFWFHSSKQVEKMKNCSDIFAVQLVNISQSANTAKGRTRGGVVAKRNGMDRRRIFFGLNAAK